MSWGWKVLKRGGRGNGGMIIEVFYKVVFLGFFFS